MELPFTADEVFSVNEQQFNALALNLFRYQATNNNIYKQYLGHIGVEPNRVEHFADIPFLPIELFKHKKIRTRGPYKGEVKYFSSSSTTGTGISKHYFQDVDWYHRSFEEGFDRIFGLNEIEIVALLPGYMERSDSSLVYMVNSLMNKCNLEANAFYLREFEALESHLDKLQSQSRKTLLIGVAHAFIDMLARKNYHYPNLIILETGGMKGRKREMTRLELHETICSGFGVSTVFSEYGMTELFSQAYSVGEGRFKCPPWMKVLIRERDDPFSISGHDKTGGINVIDLANVQSCGFIATSDLGRMRQNGEFEVLGRFDHSDVRGCSLLFAE